MDKIWIVTWMEKPNDHSEPTIVKR